MLHVIEKSYGKVFKGIFSVINPIKRKIIKTECKVHKFINNQALIILQNDGLNEEAEFFKKNIDYINKGAVWADQDLKSSNHFYNPDKDKGLYGFSNAMKECIVYFSDAVLYYKKNNVKKAAFYLGAACHLIQDMTVPQHVNIKLLKSHRKYEQWVIKTYEVYDEFKCFKEGIYIENVEDFIKLNANVSLHTYNKYNGCFDIEKKFYAITNVILCQAQKTTAGLLKLFYSKAID